MYTPQNTLTKNKTPVSKLENSPTFKDLTPLKSNNPIASRSLSFSSPSLPCVFTSPDHKELCFTSHNNSTIDKEEVVSHGEDGDSIEIKPLKDSCEEVEMDFQKMCDNNIKAKTDIPDFEKMMTTSDSGVLIYIPTNDNKEAHRFLLKTTSNSISKPSHNLSIFNRGLKGRRCLDFETLPTYTHRLDEFISKYEVHSKGKYLNPIALSSKGNQVSNEYSLQSSTTPTHDNLDGPRGEEEDTKSTPLGLLNQTSPKKKRLKTEQAIEGKSLCKRCNCKKSKCLKLYCECFAAGLYCLEPCSCLDCCNKHIYQELVSDTRRKIMLRNPLAFGPKVIKNSVSFIEAGHDATSELHKRGCHCKRSNCLKKYCECFQSRVGCSTKCRCEGCNNTFGINDESSGPKPIISLGRGSNHVNLRSLGYN